MRSLNMKRLKSFFTFDLPVNYSYIYSCFRKTHEKQRDIYSSWPAAATRRQLINEYWGNALCHYLLLFVVAAVTVWFYDGQLNGMYMLFGVTLGIAVYLPLYFILYRPIFTGDFLPKLETVIAAYEGHERAWLEKCKQNQLSNRAPVGSTIPAVKFEQPFHEWQGEKYPQGPEEAWVHYFKLIKSTIPQHILSLLPENLRIESWQCIAIIKGFEEFGDRLSVDGEVNNDLLDLLNSLIGTETKWVINFEPDYDRIDKVIKGNLNLAYKSIVESLVAEKSGFVM